MKDYLIFMTGMAIYIGIVLLLMLIHPWVGFIFMLGVSVYYYWLVSEMMK